MVRRNEMATKENEAIKKPYELMIENPFVSEIQWYYRDQANGKHVVSIIFFFFYPFE